MEIIIFTCCVVAFVMALKEFWLGVVFMLIASIILSVAEEIKNYFKGE